MLNMISTNNELNRRASFGCTLPGWMLKEIDRRRGLVNRSRYIEMLLNRALDLDGWSNHPEEWRGTDRRRGEP